MQTDKRNKETDLTRTLRKDSAKIIKADLEDSND